MPLEVECTASCTDPSVLAIREPLSHASTSQLTATKNGMSETGEGRNPSSLFIGTNNMIDSMRGGGRMDVNNRPERKNRRAGRADHEQMVLSISLLLLVVGVCILTGVKIERGRITFFRITKVVR